MSYTKSLFVLFWAAIVWTPGCFSSAPIKPAERKFYKHKQVRNCLQMDQERRESEARECWANLLKRLQSDKSFRAASELSDADIAKIQQKVDQASQRSSSLKMELDKCYKLPAPKRQKRIECFRNYLTRTKGRLSVSQRFEVESAIKEMEQAGKRAAGNIEDTVEHAGKLIGLALHMEDEGIRIDGVMDGSSLAGDVTADLEQGIIMAIDDIASADLDESERISHLEACQDKAVQLTIRKGGSDNVRFIKLEVKCAHKPEGKLLGDFSMASEICTSNTSAELDWGLSWCYHSAVGIVEIEEVFKSSPADKAGVMPGHKYTRINDKPLLGMSNKELLDILRSNAAEHLSFGSRQGVLSSPSPLSAPLLTKEQTARFWNAISLLRQKAKENKQK